MKGAGSPTLECTHRLFDVQKVYVPQLGFSAEPIADRAAQPRARGCRLLLRHNLGCARDGRVEPGKERAQGGQGFSNCVAPKVRACVGWIDSVRQSARVTIRAQALGRNLQERTREIDAGRQAAASFHTTQTAGTRTAQQREQYGFALVFGMVRRNYDGAPIPFRHTGQRLVAIVPQILFARIPGRTRRDFERQPELRRDLQDDALVLPCRWPRPMIDVTEAERKLHRRGSRMQRRGKRDRIRSSAARDERALARTEKIAALERVFDVTFGMRASH
jgi:hypothetical protein